MRLEVCFIIFWFRPMGLNHRMMPGPLLSSWPKFNQSTLTFVYVVDDSVVDKLSISMRKPKDAVIRELRHTGQQYLDDLVRKARNANLQSDTVISQGNPWNEIDRLARKENVDSDRNRTGRAQPCTAYCHRPGGRAGDPDRCLPRARNQVIIPCELVWSLPGLAFSRTVNLCMSLHQVR